MSLGETIVKYDCLRFRVMRVQLDAPVIKRMVRSTRPSSTDHLELYARRVRN